jgi:predicted Zn-dependent peptidase
LIQTRRLENGARIILEPVANTEALSLGLWFLHGSRDERDGEEGFSHFLEHMLFKGTRTHSAFQIAQSIERAGGYLNAFTEKEITCLHCLLPREHTDLAVEVLVDMAADSSLDEREIEREKQVVVNEIQTGEDSPEELAHEFYLQSFWRNHPLSRRITGNADQVLGIGREALEAFYRAHFVGENLIVTAAGWMDPERLFDRLAGKLARIPAGGYSPQRLRPERQVDCEYRRDRFQQVHLYLGTEIHEVQRLADYYRTLVFSTAFGESMSSRLFQQLREKDGLCYSVYSFRSYYSDIGLWTIYANTASSQTVRLIDALRHELARLVAEPLSSVEIEDARSQLRGNLILSREDMETRMRRLLRQYLVGGQNLEYEESLQLLERVSEEDVRQEARRLVNPNQFNLLAYGGRKIKRLESFHFSL